VLETGFTALMLPPFFKNYGKSVLTRVGPWQLFELIEE
jgi:hypothetical protein